MKKLTNAAAGFIFIVFLLIAGLGKAEETSNTEPQIVDSVYPNLASGVLTFGKLGELPDGVLMRAGNVEIGIADVNKSIAKQPEQFREQLKKNAFFVLEQEEFEKKLLQIGLK